MHIDVAIVAFLDVEVFTCNLARCFELELVVLFCEPEVSWIQFLLLIPTELLLLRSFSFLLTCLHCFQFVFFSCKPPSVHLNYSQVIFNLNGKQEI